jgi:hypothetical protein
VGRGHLRGHRGCGRHRSGHLPRGGGSTRAADADAGSLPLVLALCGHPHPGTDRHGFPAGLADRYAGAHSDADPATILQLPHPAAAAHGGADSHPKARSHAGTDCGSHPHPDERGADPGSLGPVEQQAAVHGRDRSPAHIQVHDGRAPGVDHHGYLLGKP